jgi:pyridoxal kinase
MSQDISIERDRVIKSIVDGVTCAPAPPRVLSVQSHVVSGYVGNRSAVFPLQLLGFEVDFINSVQFSNHTGYPKFTGQVLTGEQLGAIQMGLEGSGLMGYDYVLTGYIGSESFLRSVTMLLDSAHSSNPNMLYVCDPVLGDNGKYYVPKELVEVYRELILPRAYMITPNQFEAELLSGITITTMDDAILAMKALLAKGPSVVVLTSCELTDMPGLLCCIVVTRQAGTGAGTVQVQVQGRSIATATATATGGSDGGGSENETAGSAYTTSASTSVADGAAAGTTGTATATAAGGSVFKMSLDKLPGRFTGTGDCTAALLLGYGHLQSQFQEMGLTLHYTMAAVQAIIRATLAKKQRVLQGQGHGQGQGGGAEGEGEGEGSSGSSSGDSEREWSPADEARSNELALVECKRFIEHPPLVLVRAPY